MADNENVKGNRELYMARLKEKYPDKEYADDEALFGQINDDYDGYEKDLSGYKEREQALSDLFTSDPRSASFLTDWRRGEDPIVALVRRFGNDFREALDDPEKQEKLAEANKEFAAKLAKEKEYEEIYQKNLQETLGVLDQVQAEDNLSDDDIDEAIAYLISIYKDGILGKFSADSVRMALKAIHHDNDVEEADRAGEVRGRNSKIEEKLRRRSGGDGTANLSGGSTSSRAESMPELGAIDKDFGTQNIWERGGERRRSMK